LGLRHQLRTADGIGEYDFFARSAEHDGIEVQLDAARIVLLDGRGDASHYNVARFHADAVRKFYESAIWLR
jgi:hypothetical protein